MNEINLEIQRARKNYCRNICSAGILHAGNKQDRSGLFLALNGTHYTEFDQNCCNVFVVEKNRFVDTLELSATQTFRIVKLSRIFRVFGLKIRVFGVKPYRVLVYSQHNARFS